MMKLKNLLAAGICIMGVGFAVSNMAFAEELDSVETDEINEANETSEVEVVEFLKETAEEDNMESDESDESVEVVEADVESDVSDEDAEGEELLEEAEKEIEEELKKKLEDEEEVELSYQTLTTRVGNHSIMLEGNFPEGASVEAKEIGNVDDIVEDVSCAISKDYGFFELMSFDLEMTYHSHDGEKHFVPADFCEECKVSVSNISGKDKVSVYSIGDDINTMSTDGATFTMSDAETYTVGIAYCYDTSVYGKSNKANKGTTIIATGDGVTYKTQANERGEYLFTDVDYSKAFFGCCFEIKVG